MERGQRGAISVTTLWSLGKQGFGQDGDPLASMDIGSEDWSLLYKRARCFLEDVMA